MKSINELIVSGKLREINATSTAPTFTTRYLVFLHESSNRFHVAKSSGCRIYIRGFLSECKEKKEHRDSYSFSSFKLSTNKLEWKIYIAAPDTTRNDLEQDLIRKAYLQPFE